MVIHMKTIFKFFSTIGKCLVVLLLLDILAVSIVSIKMSYENVSNPFCFNKYENEKIQFNYNEIKKYEYHFQCSTLYVTMEVDEQLSKEEIVSLLLSISQDLKEYDCFTHFEIKSASLVKSMYATINLKTNEISYV